MPPSSWIATYIKPKGYVSPLELDLADIDIRDITHALGNLCRFGGHCREFYSVAQHSVHVAEHLGRAGLSLEAQLVGLLHDASEAYISDICSPIKHTEALREYRLIELDITRKVYNKLIPDIDWLDWIDTVRDADIDLLRSEVTQLFNVQPEDWGLTRPRDYFHIKPVGPRDAKILFEEAWLELKGAFDGLQ